MAEGATQGKYGKLPEKLREKIKANAAAAENTAWFFGEDIFIATGAILLMKGILRFSRYACRSMGYGTLGHSDSNICTYCKLD